MAGYFVLKSGAKGNFMFNLKAGNHEVILTSESYSGKAAAEAGIASVQANAGNDARYERKTSKAGEPYFVLKGGNGQVIGKSEMYASAASMEGGIASVKKNGASKTVKEPAA